MLGRRHFFGPTAALVLIFAMLAAPASAKQPVKGASSWSSQVAISAVNQPDPTRGSQLSDVAINASGQAIAAWDQFLYSNGGAASIGAAGGSGGRGGTPLTLSSGGGVSTTPPGARGADGKRAGSLGSGRG